MRRAFPGDEIGETLFPQFHNLTKELSVDDEINGMGIGSLLLSSDEEEGNLQYMRKFCEAFLHPNAVRSDVSWTNDRKIMALSSLEGSEY